MWNFIVDKNYLVTRKIMMVATPTAVPKGEQQIVMQFLTLENVSVVKFIWECVWCMVCRMLSQNQLWTDGYRDLKLHKRVQVTTLLAVDHWKGPTMACHRHQQTHSSVRKIPSSQLYWKVRYDLENKVFLVWDPFVDFLQRMDLQRKTFEVPLIVSIFWQS